MDGDIKNHSNHRTKNVRESVPAATFTPWHEGLMEFVAQPKKGGQSDSGKDQRERPKPKIMFEGSGDQETQKGIF
jgi:hypothetical protein